MPELIPKTGAVGQEENRVERKKTFGASLCAPCSRRTAYRRPRPLWAILAAPLALQACALEQQDIVFAGPVTPLAGTCDPATRGTLTLRHRAVQFAPSSGVLVLAGTVASDGSLAASLKQSGIDKASYQLQLQARLTGETVVGEYRTPRCRYAVRLSKS